LGWRSPGQSGGSLTLVAPPLAPSPGYYLLFMLNSEGVPSVGAFIELT
jgi:hypothetical protein